jgi:hypothetical protein
MYQIFFLFFLKTRTSQCAATNSGKVKSKHTPSLKYRVKNLLASAAHIMLVRIILKWLPSNLLL